MIPKEMSGKKIHFIGIGGIGMSALARYYHAQKLSVSGSDMANGQIPMALRKEAINVKIGHKKGNIPPGMPLIVISQAIRKENPELQEAIRRGLRVLTYPEAIGELTEQYKTIAIAGAHGKSTTTALAALSLIKAGLDPTVILGVNLKEFGGKNFRLGNGQGKKNAKEKWLVLEADEFGRAFLNYSPFITIATNIDREHLDIYKNLANIKAAFLKLFENTENTGALILNRDDRNLSSLRQKIGLIARKKKLRVIWYPANNTEAKKIKGAMKIPGAHNISNAAAVYQLGKVLNISETDVLAALGSYRGAWRRMEYRGTFQIKERGASLKISVMPVYDDYAHHPTEIKATLKAFKEKFAGRPLICIFQPHQAKRLQALFKEFTSAFTDADMLALIPSYNVAGRDDSDSKFTAERLAAAIIKKYRKKQVYYFATPKNIKKSLIKLLMLAPFAGNRSPVIIMMGAGDIVKYTNLLLK